MSLVLAYGFHKIGWLSLKNLHQIALKFIFSGRSVDEIAALSESFWDLHLQKLIRPQLLERFHQFQNQGFKTVLSSSSPTFLVTSIARRLGFDESHASQYLVDKEGKFVRILVLVNGEEKKKQLEAILERAANKALLTTAFSDSFLDLPLLLRVDKPVCVNPDKKLRRFAEQYSWEIIEDGCSIQCSQGSL